MGLTLGRFTNQPLKFAGRCLALGGWFFFLPFGIYSLCLEWGYSLESLQVVLMAVAFVGIVVVNLETLAVLYRRRLAEKTRFRGLMQRWFLRRKVMMLPAIPLSPEPLPFVSVVVAAYLPNEQDIILETLEHWLTRVQPPAAGWEIILAYNTPTPLPIEADLRDLAQRHPELVLLPVPHSTSKAENLNMALHQVKGAMTCIFDADHQPAADCLERAWDWLSQGHYDAVQGRNIIRNANDNWLTAMIAVEFECIYGVNHYGRSLLTDTALFGGSNGYWRTGALRTIGFSASRLTEDIDATLRALLQGYRIVHDPTITTTELAPVSLRSLWLQRQRWSQGWMEVAGRYLRNVVRSPHFDSFQRTCWALMLLYSLYFHTLVWQAFPLSVSLALIDPNRDPMLEVWNMALIGILLLSMVVQVVLAIHPRHLGSPLTWRHGIIFCLLSPLYFWFKSAIALVAFYNHLCGSRTWHVTRRTRGKSKRWALGSRS